MSAPSISQPNLDRAAAHARDAYFSDAVQSAADIPTAELAPPVREEPVAPGGGDLRRAILDQTARLETLLGLWAAEDDGLDGAASAFPTAAQIFLGIDPTMPVVASGSPHSDAEHACATQHSPDASTSSLVDDYAAQVAQQLFGSAAKDAA